MEMKPALEIRRITKKFGALRAVDGVSFQVRAGEIVGFIGPNGAGKTTTMRMCATLEIPDEGDIFVDGLSVLDNAREVRARIGFMPDSFGAYANTTVLEYLDFFARAYGLRGEKRRSTLDQVIDFTSLRTLLTKETASLSKGMKQRLCLAKTLLHDPPVLILDEPASGLDPRARIELRELLKALAEMGKAVLISSHILTELSEMCHGVAVIERGRIRATGGMAEVTQAVRPKTQCFVRSLGPREDLERALRESAGVDGVRFDGAGLLFEYVGSDEGLSLVLAELVRRGLRPVEFAVRNQNLEDLFLALTEGKVQ